MSTLTALQPITTFVPSVFLDAPKLNHAGQPEWFVDSQQQAWGSFTALPMPSRKEENWRFASLSLLQFDAFRRFAGEAAPEYSGLDKVAARVVLTNDSLISLLKSTTQGLEVLCLADALKTHGEALREYFTAPDARLGGAKFAALNHAQLSEAVVIIVAPNTEVAEPVEIIHSLAGENASAFPRTIVLAGANARVTVVEHQLSAGDDAGFSCGAATIKAEAGANISYVLVNRMNAASKTVHLSTVSAARDSHVKHTILNLGSGYVRTEALNLVNGQGSRSELLSVNLASPGQEVDQRTLQDHLSPGAGSDLLYKNVLFGNARTVFAGLIRVAENAHQTDAYQKCRNLLLSDECEANSMPGLEINADQVRCSHGSTSGRISEEELFYLKARGIEPEIASHLIGMGFTAEVVARIGHPAVQEWLENAIEERFAALEH